jgi:hypothetical protein
MNTIEIYISKDRQTQVEVSFSDDSVWVSQVQMERSHENVPLDANMVGSTLF